MTQGRVSFYIYIYSIASFFINHTRRGCSKTGQVFISEIRVQSLNQILKLKPQFVCVAPNLTATFSPYAFITATSVPP